MIESPACFATIECCAALSDDCRLGLTFPAMEVEAQVEVDDGVCQGSDADSINSGFSDCPDGVERHAAAGFELHLRGSFVADGDGFAELLGRHIVEENDVGLAVDDVAKLRERVDFDLDRDAPRRSTACLAKCFGQ